MVKLLTAVTATTFLLVGCASKEVPATQAVASAEAALSAVRPDAAKYAPDQLQLAEADLAKAKADLARKHYHDVLVAAPKFNQEVTTLKETVVAKQTQLAAATNEWQDLSEEVPRMVDAIENSVAYLSGAKRQQAKADLAAMKSQWAEADAAFNAGDPTKAADKGRIVQARAKEVSVQLGLNPA